MAKISSNVLKLAAMAKRINIVGLSDLQLFRKVTGLNYATDEFINADKSDWYVSKGKYIQDTNDDGVIDDNDSVDTIKINQYVQANPDAISVSSIEEINAIENKEEADIIISDESVMNTLTSNDYYNSITLVGGQIHNNVKLNSLDTITIDSLNIAGEKGASNGKIVYTAKDVVIKNITSEQGSTVYNMFEGSQTTTDPNYTGLENLVAENLVFDNPSLSHNVINVYTPANNAVITIKNSTFNLDVNNSNVLRLANYLNSDNVTINFENVEWTYENAITNSSDFKWAGLIIYQPASKDVALTGDVSHLATWTFNFKNCKYNGELVTENNFGKHSQVIYFYNLNKNNAVTNPEIEGITINFS